MLRRGKLKATGMDISSCLKSMKGKGGEGRGKGKEWRRRRERKGEGKRKRKKKDKMALLRWLSSYRYLPIRLMTRVQFPELT